jgi:hypothetical protein
MRDMAFEPITLADFVSVKTNIGETFPLTIRPAGLSRDAICLVWGSKGRGWQIVQMFPMIE